jgi:hypothetical protein
VLDHCVRDTEPPYDRRSGWYEQAEDRPDGETLEHVKSYSGADAFAAQDVAKPVQRVVQYTRGLALQLEDNEEGYT